MFHQAERFKPGYSLYLVDIANLQFIPEKFRNKTILMGPRAEIKRFYFLSLGHYLPEPFDFDEFHYHSLPLMKKNKEDGEIKRFLFTGTEWTIIEYFRKNRNRLLKYETILNDLSLISIPSLKMYIYRIRKKISQHSKGERVIIYNIKQQGYIWNSLQ